MSGRIPDFKYKLTERERQRVVLIVDLNLGAMSVTNGAEAVLATIEEVLADHQELKGAKVYYRDSERQWDEIKLDSDGKFAGFAALSEELREWCPWQWNRIG